ncbi:hypothetical protein FK535_00765 [Mycolicibacterium sp. 018/SC-01/001]|nr:hypothetical protein FK535_00765 [Mycolicibacterium sp. 018/SC-01/001]
MIDEILDPWSYGDRPAWALFYRRRDCKVQVCWSERDGGIDFMLAPPGADNTFGLSDRTGTWHFMLLLSRAKDNLITPPFGAKDDVVMAWLRDLFRIHFKSACEAVNSIAQGTSNDVD